MGAASVFAEMKTATDLPVSAIGNTACMSSMSERPWWNKAWTRRAPILVSSAVDVEDRNVMVDAIVDFGEAVVPEEVRVVTPWEELVDCVAEQVKVKGEGEQGKIRLLFKTGLRVRENKPFLVYWGNPKAGKPVVRSSLTMVREGDELKVQNGVLSVSFDTRQKTEGLIRRLRILGSQAPSAIQMRSTGYAWGAFTVGPWTNATVVADNAFKKSVAFKTVRYGVVTMTVYDEQPRVDWSVEKVRGLDFHMSWACGNDTGFDRIYYPGLSGKVLSVMADIDSQTDCIPHPKYKLGPYLSKGWYAFADRRENDVVGMVFDISALSLLESIGDGGAYGELMVHRFAVPSARDGGIEGIAGSLVARHGTWKDVEAEEARLRKRPLVFAGRPEGVREIPVKVTRLDRDWVHSIDHGSMEEIRPLEGTEWATNAACTWRSMGATAMRAGPNWSGLPVPRDLYDQVTNRVLALDPKRRPWLAKWGENDNFTGRKYAEQCAAAHAKGLAVNIWGGFCGDAYQADRTDPELVKYDIEIQNLYPKCGLDCVYNAAAQGEGAMPTLPPALVKAHNNEPWTRWEDVDTFFKAQDENTERVKNFYREAKRRNPDKPVVMWNGSCCEMGREMFMSDQVGYFDTCMVEIMPNDNFPRAKQSVKEMLAHFDNEPGRTVHHHYYFYGTDRQDYFYRVSNLEMPFICGCHGFSQENMTYGHADREAMQIPADFARFAEYTRLGEKVAKMAPVKNLAVLRDIDNYRWDVRHNEYGAKHGWYARSDRRVANFARLKNYNYDTVLAAYFTAKALAKYRIVFVPENPVLAEARAKELLAYVKNGGSAVLEGETVEKLKSRKVEELKVLGELKDGEIKSFGKGKIVWYKTPVSDGIGADMALTAKVLKDFDAMGARPSHALAGSKTLDSILHASDEGMFLGVYNMGTVEDKGKVKLNLQLAERAAPLWVLDVKKGERFAWTNGFEIAVGPKQCGFYLIGDDKFTALPAAKPCVWGGAGVVKGNPKFKPKVSKVPEGFTQAIAVEYTGGTAEKPQTTRRSFENAIIVRPMTKDVYSARRMNEALDGATYLHFVARDAATADQVFEDCPDALKALLKRGGGIVFDRMATGPKARAFLKEVGVYDPNEAAVSKGDDAVLCSNLSTNSLLYPKPAGWFNQGLHFGRGFPKWDKEKQFVTHLGKHETNLAMAVAQEGVLGAGKVIFAQNDRAFDDWYENMRYGDSIQSWMIGRQVSEHAQLVRDLNGGEGRVEK